jgi:hypothetical protein
MTPWKTPRKFVGEWDYRTRIIPVFPTGRNFGRKTQKRPLKNMSGRENPRPNILQICLKMAEKGPNFFEV